MRGKGFQHERRRWVKNDFNACTSPSSDNTLKTPPNPQEDLGLKAASSPGSIPLSPNYFDALSGIEKDAPLEERDFQTRPMENQRISSPSKDPN